MKKVLLAIALLCFKNTAFSQKIAGEILVQIKYAHQKPLLHEALKQIFGENDTDTETKYSLEDIGENSTADMFADAPIFKIKYPPQYLDEKISTTLKNLPFVQNVQYNYQLKKRTEPNDALFGQQWYLHRINAAAMWTATTGGVSPCGDSIVVAVIDEEYTHHTDLAPNYWRNKKEIPLNNIDDDQNGYTDDLNGANVKTQNGTHTFGAHGTEVAGVIAAKGNNSTGIAGLNWTTKLMILSGVTNDEEIVKAYNYIYAQRSLYNTTQGREGAYIVVTNMSLGYNNSFPNEHPLLCAIYDRMGSLGILNIVASTNIKGDIDKIGDMPSLCPSENLIVATASNRSDNLITGFSKKSVDIAAPGEDILTTYLNDTYEMTGGASLAAPQVAGAVALLWSLNAPKICQRTEIEKKDLIKAAILRGVQTSSVLMQNTVSGGRLDLEQALRAFNRLLYGAAIGDAQLLNIYPNPTTQDINVEIQIPIEATGNDIGSIEIQNSNGQYIYVYSITENDLAQPKIALKLQNIAAGCYFVKLRVGNYIETKRLVVIP